MLGVKHRWTRTVHEVQDGADTTRCGYLFGHEGDWEKPHEIEEADITCKLCLWWREHST